MTSPKSTHGAAVDGIEAARHVLAVSERRHAADPGRVAVAEPWKRPLLKAADTPPEGMDAWIEVNCDPGVFEVWTRVRGEGEASPAPETLPRTEIGLAERFVARHRHEARFCHPWGKWLTWDGRRWGVDDRARVRSMSKATVRSLLEEAARIEDEKQRRAHVAWALSCERKRCIDAMLGLAAAENGITIVPDEMDRDPWLLNCLNGTLDLRTGRLRPHDPGDILTKLCPVEYDAAAECPLWESTLERFLPDPAIRRYIQRVAGYAITGAVRDHVLPIFYGTGANGKSTVLNTLIDLLGSDYAMKAAPDLLLSRDGNSHPTERASLFGKRLVVAIETEDGQRFNESLVKELTGGDQITARRMREDFWSFMPTHKIILATNHRPTVRGTDRGIWRRLKLIPFSVAIDDAAADTTMPERIRDELPGVLAWAVRGCMDWQRDGLAEPEEVASATRVYRQDEDVLGRFMDERCVISPGVRVQAAHLYGEYKGWAEESGLGVMSLVKFGKSINERGFEKENERTVSYLGIGLRRHP